MKWIERKQTRSRVNNATHCFSLIFSSLVCLFCWCSDKWSRISCMNQSAYARNNNNNVLLKKRQWNDDRNAFSLNIEHWTLVRMPNTNFSSNSNKQYKTHASHQIQCVLSNFYHDSVKFHQVWKDTWAIVDEIIHAVSTCLMFSSWKWGRRRRNKNNFWLVYLFWNEKENKYKFFYHI